jgi:MerR family redox-sensitive transcriptional activator SoxR
MLNKFYPRIAQDATSCGHMSDFLMSIVTKPRLTLLRYNKQNDQHILTVGAATMPKNQLTIGEVANLVGLEPSTLRYYESIGLLAAPPRQHGQRRYPPSVLAVLAIIKLAKEAHCSLPEIHQLLYAQDGCSPSERWLELANAKVEEINHQLASLLASKALLEESIASESLHYELDQALTSS